MIDIETQDVKIEMLFNEKEKQLMVDVIFSLTKMDFKKRVVFMTHIINDHKEFSKISMGEFMSFNSSVFHGFLLNAPDGPDKDNFIDETIALGLTFKSTSKAAS